MTKSKGKSRYYLSGIINLAIFLLMALVIYYIWINSYNTRLIEIDEYKAGLRDRVEQDSIRQILYPFGYMPIISFIYGLLEGRKKYRFVIPFIAAIVVFFLDYIASDGGKHLGEALPWEDFFTIGIPSFIGALIGVGVIRAIFAIIKAFKSRNKK